MVQGEALTQLVPSEGVVLPRVHSDVPEQPTKQPGAAAKVEHSRTAREAEDSGTRRNHRLLVKVAHDHAGVPLMHGTFLVRLLQPVRRLRLEGAAALALLVVHLVAAEDRQGELDGGRSTAKPARDCHGVTLLIGHRASLRRGPHNRPSWEEQPDLRRTPMAVIRPESYRRRPGKVEEDLSTGEMDRTAGLALLDPWGTGQWRRCAPASAPSARLSPCACGRSPEVPARRERRGRAVRPRPRRGPERVVGGDLYDFVGGTPHERGLRPHLSGPASFVPVSSGLSSSQMLVRVSRTRPGQVALSLRRRLQPVTGPPPVPNLIDTDRYDVVHFPAQRGETTRHPTVYRPWDLQHLHYPEFFTPEERQTRAALYRPCCERARFVIVASPAVRS